MSSPKVVPMLERLEAALKHLRAAAVEYGMTDVAPEMMASNELLQELQHARARKPNGAGIEGHSEGPWLGDFYQADHGASLAVCNREHGVIALIPFATLDDAEPGDVDSITAEDAPQEAFDVPNFRRLLACVNACEGMSTTMLEALRPDVSPFVDNCGRNYVVFSRYALEHGDGAGFWSNGHGWVELSEATRFTQRDTMTLNLPMSGSHSDDGCSCWTDLASARAEVAKWERRLAAELEGARP